MPHDDVTSLLLHIPNTGRLCVAAIRDQAIFGTHRKLAQGLAVAFALAAGEPEKIAGPLRHAQAEMHSPLTAGLPGFLHVCAVNESHFHSRTVGQRQLAVVQQPNA